jgi:hypothetical protein
LSYKKKILFINPHQFGHTTGYYYYCQYLKTSFDITLICLDEGLKKLDICGVKIIYISRKKNKFNRLFFFILDSVKETYKLNYDVVYVYSFYFSFIISLFSRKSKKILDIRTGSIATNQCKRFLFNNLIKLNTFFFSRVIILSNDLIDLLKINKSKCHLLPLGAEKYFDGIHTFNDMKLLYIGALNTRNVAQSVEGVYYFLRNNHFKFNISYKIIGFGNPFEEELLIETIEKLKLKNYVVFEGRKNYEELPDYFQNSNIGVSWVPITPAFNYQPATKTFEYILSGLFCMATSTKANRDLINNKNGILFKDTPEAFAEALEEVFKLKNSISSVQIQKTLEGFSWQELIHYNLTPFLKSL